MQISNYFHEEEKKAHNGRKCITMQRALLCVQIVKNTCKENKKEDR